MEGLGELPPLDERQNIFLDAVMNSLRTDEAVMFFLEGPAGTGKTYTLNEIIRRAREAGKEVAPVAMSRMGSTKIQHGMTAHSTFVLPWRMGMDIEDEEDLPIHERTMRGKWLPTVDLVLWDEVQRSTMRELQLADTKLRELCKNDRPFGGKVVVFAGDQRSINPMVYADAFCWELWPSVKAFPLTMNHRFSEDWFIKLTEIGSGRCELWSPQPGIPDRLVPLDNEMVVETPLELIQNTFTEGIINENNPEPTMGRAILTRDNDDARKFNLEIMDYLHFEQVRIIRGTTTPDTEDNKRLNHTLVPPHELRLCVGAKVKLLRDSRGLRHSTYLTVVRIHKKYKFIECRVQTANHAGETVRFLKEEFKLKGGITRTQFPVVVEYAMTIDQAQGQHLEKVGVYLRSNVYRHGQLYAALSRVRRREDVKILLDGYARYPVKEHPETIFTDVVFDRSVFFNVARSERL